MLLADRIFLGARLTAGALLLAAWPVHAQAPAPPPAPRAVTLAEAIKLSEQVQPRVVQATSNLETADARLRTSRAQYLPNVQLNSSGSNFKSGGPPRFDPNSQQLVPGGSSSTSLNTGLSASVDLFTGFRRGADVRAARASTEAAGASLSDAKFQQRLETTNQFLAALAATRLRRVRDASVQRAEEQLKVSIARLHAGSATRSDSLRSLVTLGTARMQLIQADVDLASAEANLARLVGASGRVAAIDDSAYYHPVSAVDTAQLLTEARASSPQVQAARASFTASDATVKSAKSAYWPTLTLTGNTGFNGSTSTDYTLYNQRQVSLQLSWRLFDRFNREQQIAISESNRDLAAAQADESQRAVEANLIAQLANLDAAQARTEITTTSVAAATEDLRVVRERYRLGVATIVDVLTSQEALTQAEVDAVNARFDYLRAKAQIETLIGRSL
jgi:outer membrane protein